MPSFAEDWLNTVMSVQPPTSFPGSLSNNFYQGFIKGYDKTHQDFVNNMQRISGKEALPQSIQQTMGANTPATNAANSLIGSMPKPQTPSLLGGAEPMVGSSYKPPADLMGAGGFDMSKILNPQNAGMLGLSMVGPAAQKLTGSPAIGQAGNAAGSIGIAAMQGFQNPLSDVMAVYNVLKMIPGLRKYI